MERTTRDWGATLGGIALAIVAGVFSIVDGGYL